MLITSVSNSPQLYSKQTVLKSQSQHKTSPIIKNPVVDKVSFSGLNPEIARNQLKILLTQDIWAPNLRIKMPETPLEKEVILEILEHKLQLDRLVRLTNEKLNIKTKIKMLANLMEQNPSHPDLPALRKEIENKGNLDSYLKTLDKNIELEQKKKKPALEYFKHIDELEEEYTAKHLLKNSAFDKFWHKIIKNNINPDGKLSTQELIDIIREDKAPVVERVIKTTSPILSKKQLLSRVQSQYEQMLREGVDVYKGEGNHNDVAKQARKTIAETYADSIKKQAGIDKQLTKIFESVEQKYTFKVDRLDGIDIYPIGEIWKDMKADEKSIKQITQEISQLKEKLAKTPDSQDLKDLLTKKETELQNFKDEWVSRLGFSVKYEGINRERMVEADRLPEYDYLTSENKTIKKHKRIFDIYKTNNDTIPETMWAEIIA